MKRAVWFALAGGLILAACATQKEMVPIGGSRADGTVNMAFEYGIFESPQVNMSTAAVGAADRCRAWGYKDAEPFGGQTQKCEAANGYGTCMRWMVTVTYQCTGSPPASR